MEAKASALEAAGVIKNGADAGVATPAETTQKADGATETAPPTKA